MLGQADSRPGSSGLGDNNRKAFKRVLDLAITHKKKDEFKWEKTLR